MDLTVIGAGPAFTDRLGATGASYLLRSGHGPGDATLLLDLGQGSFPRLASAVEPSSLSAVLVSHLHPDHFIDLVPLRHYLRFQLAPPRRVRVVAPPGLVDRLDALHGQPGFCHEALDIEELATGKLAIGPFEVEARPVAHGAGSHAFRVAVGGGIGLVYSGDCGAIDDLVGLVRPGDVLLVEVSFGTGPVPDGAMHLDAPTVRALAQRARPSRVLLTHLLMGWDRAATVRAVQDGVDAPVELVEPGYETMIDRVES